MSSSACFISFLFTRGIALGVRAVCFDDRGRISGAAHLNLPGWYLPGGGVECGETPLMALHKKILEKAMLTCCLDARFSIDYLNLKGSNRDHVVLYRLAVIQTQLKKLDHEIAEMWLFGLSDLREGMTLATRCRLAEFPAKRRSPTTGSGGGLLSGECFATMGHGQVQLLADEHDAGWVDGAVAR